MSPPGSSPAPASPLAVISGAALLNLCLGSSYAWSVFVEPLQTEFGASSFAMSTIFAGSLVVFCATTVAGGGRLADRLAPRSIAIGAALLTTVGMAASAVAPSLWFLAVAYAGVFGLANGFGYVLAVTTAGRAWPQRRGTGVGLAVAGYALGPLVVAGPAVALIGTVGWRTTFLVLAGALGAFMLLAAWLLPDRVPAIGVQTPDPIAWTPRLLLRHVNAHLLWATFALGAFTALMTIGHAAPLAVERGLSPWQAGTAVAVLALGNATGRAVAGPLSDRVDRFAVLTGVMVATAAGALLIGLSTGPATVLPAVVTIGLAYGALATLVPTATLDLFGEARFGANFAVIFTAWGVASLLGPPVGGWIADHHGYAAAHQLGGLAAIVGLLAALTLLVQVRREGVGATQ